jgi:alkaline phosphatase D
LFFQGLFSQEKYLQSGPMVGYSEMREVLLWVQTNTGARVKFVYFEEGNPSEKHQTEETVTEKQTAYTAKLTAENLEPGKVYQYELYINNKPINLPYPLKFQTRKLWQWRGDPPDFKFVTGSCNYVNDPPYDRPGTPYGDNYEIFTAIYNQQPDMMLWLGDNSYLREVDWYSRSGILYRNTHTRSLPELQPLLASVHHYAIWDDHDYGPNNSDRSFRQKEDALEAFKLFWGNPTFGINGQPGATTIFQWADVDFFLLDNRYYHSPNNRYTGERTLLGEAQINWLIDALSTSEALFKFIVVGGQFLNPVTYGENFSTFPEERSQILQLLSRESISGVIFLTGDRHHTELSKLERENLYPLYDLTVSPLTASPNPENIEERNVLRVPGTFVGERNFARIAVTGPKTDRMLEITVFSSAGAELWTRTIKANDLK